MKTRTCSRHLSQVVRDSAWVLASSISGTVLSQPCLELVGQAADLQMEAKVPKILTLTGMDRTVESHRGATGTGNRVASPS